MKPSKKSKPKKSSSKIKNKKISPRCSTPIGVRFRRVKLTDKLKKRIEKIEVKYGFLKKFNLQSTLTKLPLDFANGSELVRQKTTPVELLKLYSETQSIGEQAIKIVADINKIYSTIEKFGELLKNYGNYATKMLSNDKNIKIINQLKISTDYFSTNKTIEQKIHLNLIYRLSPELIKMINDAKYVLPCPKTGKPTDKTKKWLIRWLIETYISGTKKAPKIGWKSGAGRYCKIKDDYKGKYTGDFFRYVRAIKPAIEEILKIKLGKTNALAQECRETYRKEYKNTLKVK